MIPKLPRTITRLLIGSVIGGAILMGGEVLARQMESGSANDTLFNYFFYDEQQLRKEMIRDGGIFHGGYQVRVNSRGFRDSKSWPPLSQSDPQDLNERRIVIGGAGHGYGENVTDGLIYAHLLEESLQKRKPATEIYNLSVQGSTILFFERTLLEEVIEVKPDVVILSYTGFNEALYSRHREANVLFPHNTVYNLAMSSALVRRIHLILFAESQQVNRVTPDEMIESYTRVLTALREHNIELMLLQQVVIHPDIEGLWSLSEMDAYRERVIQFAKEEDIPLADPVTFCKNLEDCFERKEWYSTTGHRAAFQSLELHHRFLLNK